MKDQLFMLKPGFFDGDKGPLYCADAVSIEGMLGFFPQLREKIDVHYIDAPRPRSAIVELLGEENQGTPVLVLAEGSTPRDIGLQYRTAGKRRFIDSPADIRRYLSSQYGIAHSSAD